MGCVRMYAHEKGEDSVPEVLGATALASIRYAYDRFLIEARTAAPKTLGNLIALPESGTQVDPGLNEFATQTITSYPETVIRRQGGPFYDQITKCLLSKCPDVQLDYRNPAPYRNTFTVKALYGTEGLGGIARTLAGLLNFGCFLGYKFSDDTATRCTRICTQPVGQFDLPVLTWEMDITAPSNCPYVAVACVPAACPAIAGFPGSVTYIDTWDPVRVRFFGSDLKFDHTKGPADALNQVNAMYDLYDQNWAYDTNGNPEMSSCLSRYHGLNPLQASDVGLYPPPPENIGSPMCERVVASLSPATTDTYICKGNDLPDRMPSEHSGFGHGSVLYDAMNNVEFTTANSALYESAKHAKLAVKESLRTQCATEPASPKAGGPVGCAGALKTDGTFDKELCEGTTPWYSICCKVVDGSKCETKSVLVPNMTPLNEGWQTSLKHQGAEISNADEGIPTWAWWERCLAMTQLVNLRLSGNFALPAAENLQATKIPSFGAPMDGFGARYRGGATPAVMSYV